MRRPSSLRAVVNYTRKWAALLAWRFAAYRAAHSLRHISGPETAAPPGALLLFAVCRNERLRLPHFFAHYRALGIERFFVADNNSTDGSLEYLREQPATTVFTTTQRYDDALYGIGWLHALLRRYGEGHWCVIADIDEFLVHPYMEEVSLGELCCFLEAEGATSLPALLIDMYSKGPLDQVTPTADGNLLDCCPWFDPDGYIEIPNFTTGGPRVRVFGIEPALDKVPLLYYRDGVRLRAGCHHVEHTAPSALRAGVLHFKFLDDFARRTAEEVVRKQHWRGAQEYVQYRCVIEQKGTRDLWYPGAQRYGSSGDLLACGLARSSAAYDAWRCCSIR